MCDFNNIEKLNKNDVPSRIFVTGIGTDVGKSYATGWLAREFRKLGMKSITQKFIQTGNREYSEDIDTHRKIMGIEYQNVDKLHITAPLILSYPASPHLAAKIDNVKVDYKLATFSTTALLSSGYRPVLIEGAGGLMVPLEGHRVTLDYIKEQELPVVIVTNGQLGSLNHTLLTIEMCIYSDIKIWALVYNPYFDIDEVICKDTKEYLKNFLRDRLLKTHFFEMPDFTE